jgi:hypothetical protein
MPSHVYTVLIYLLMHLQFGVLYRWLFCMDTFCMDTLAENPASFPAARAAAGPGAGGLGVEKHIGVTLPIIFVTVTDIDLILKLYTPSFTFSQP